MKLLNTVMSVGVLTCAQSTLAVEETLQNDSFDGNSPVTFQAGFIAGEIAASRFVPQIACPCVVTDVSLLFGGSQAMQTMSLAIWDDSVGSDNPGALLFTGDVALTG